MKGATSVAAFLAVARGKIDRLDARLLLQHVSGLSHVQLIAEPQTALSDEQMCRLDVLLERRAAGEPLAYLVGQAGFRGRGFAVTPDVLIPRPETEELVDLALEKLRAAANLCSAPRCLDLGSGSGVIAISLKLEFPAAEVHAVEVSPAALDVARANAAALGATVEFREGSWYAPLADERFDLIVSNPPYIAVGDPHLELNGLPFEPAGALSDGGDGLDCIRTIITGAPMHLQPGGWLLFEHGFDQGAAVRNLLCSAGLEMAFTANDLSGQERISGGRKPHV